VAPDLGRQGGEFLQNCAVAGPRTAGVVLEESRECLAALPELPMEGLAESIVEHLAGLLLV